MGGGALSPVEVWRRVVQDRLLQAAAGIIAFIGVVLTLSTEIRNAIPPMAFVAFPAVATLLYALSHARRLSFGFKSVVLVGSIWIVAFSIIACTALYLPSAFVALLFPPVLCSLLHGTKAALLALAMSALLLLVGGILYADGTLVPSLGPLDPRKLENWLRIIAIFIAISGGTMLSTGFLIDRLRQDGDAIRSLNASLVEKSKLLQEEISTRQVVNTRVTQNQKLEALGSLAGGVAHDFNNLLTVISASAALAKDENIEVERKVLLDEVQRAAERASELTRDLLAFSRQQVLPRKPVALGLAVAASLRLVRCLIPANILIATPRMDEKVHVLSAPIELDQILFNLCLNARDAMPVGGVITVSVDEHDGMACLTVRDTGCGMDALQRERIFDPFFTTKASGTGLGLSVVHGVVTQHQGRIEFDSELGHGTEFRVYLPIIAPPPPETATRARAGEGKGGAGRILVVDDEASIRQVMSRILKSAGFSVEVCSDGDEALAVMREHGHEFALVLTDAIMPRMGGRELHDAVQSFHPEVPFLFCSGYASQTIASDILDMPGRGFISKPFTPTELVARVKALLDAHARAV